MMVMASFPVARKSHCCRHETSHTPGWWGVGEESARARSNRYTSSESGPCCYPLQGLTPSADESRPVNGCHCSCSACGRKRTLGEKPYDVLCERDSAMQQVEMVWQMCYVCVRSISHLNGCSYRSNLVYTRSMYRWQLCCVLWLQLP
jgi:hypothetical protein